MRFDAILFDCDGVLVDSEVVGLEDSAAFLADRGFDWTPEDLIRRFTGMRQDAFAAGLRSAYDAVLGRAATDPEAEALMDGVIAARRASRHAMTLVPGAAAPKLISSEMIQRMQPGSVLVDVAIDQGGCAETSTPTTHAEPTYVIDEVVHYCVANMPGGVARTSTQALNNATLPFVLALADKGVKRALTEDAHLAQGLNLSGGVLCNAEVAQALQLPVQPLSTVISALPD